MNLGLEHKLASLVIKEIEREENKGREEEIGELLEKIEFAFPFLLEKIMATVGGHHMLAFIFGLLGNLVSFMVYLAPLPTFYRVYKRKSTEGFQSIPYVVALFSASLWLYYALIKTNGSMIMTINSIGCVIEGFYIIVYLIYAHRSARIFTIKLLLFLNVFVYGLILALTYLLAKGNKRVAIVGWICSAFAVSVFAAPLSIIRLVIKTKSVEYMPFMLSFFLTICAIMWFFYGMLMKDRYVAFPNVLGFSFGIAQMVLYILYKDARPTVVASEIKLPKVIFDVKGDDEPKLQANSNQVEEVIVTEIRLPELDLDVKKDEESQLQPNNNPSEDTGPNQCTIDKPAFTPVEALV